MARLPRLMLAGQTHHVIQRGNNHQPIVLDDADRQHYLNQLHECAATHKVAIHAYVLMDNHLHLLATPEVDQGISQMMQALGRRYVVWFNHKYGRSGTLWEGRFRAALIDSERYLMACMRYIELNPVRAGMCASAEAYPWSSCAHHLGRRSDPLINDHALFWSLGNTPFERELAYRELLDQGLPEPERLQFHDAAMKGRPIGSPEFLKSLADKTLLPLALRPRGRPRKTQSEAELNEPDPI
ncbi:transposase [Paucibacter sp. TC2R-5]|uniref:REP-associated tyrosine transposase n=1 Tax=Paucibacter sp. TC2R-5 TaxID=2893555 RepID=UPI0021E46CB3|nr:transposase [Paucibacter sp. TC2R-5]MCV2359491.1 transposase [Paucibacter sp. TC2R-5]